eukprot:1561653-Alexandrium_andersonii.AAC.1
MSPSSGGASPPPSLSQGLECSSGCGRSKALGHAQNSEPGICRKCTLPGKGWHCLLYTSPSPRD